eukprot:scaffold10045_cov64-Phaeocystis_antarctica.AAC.7
MPIRHMCLLHGDGARRAFVPHMHSVDRDHCETRQNHTSRSPHAQRSATDNHTAPHPAYPHTTHALQPRPARAGTAGAVGRASRGRCLLSCACADGLQCRVSGRSYYLKSALDLTRPFSCTTPPCNAADHRELRARSVSQQCVTEFRVYSTISP